VTIQQPYKRNFTKAVYYKIELNDMANTHKTFLALTLMVNE